VGAFNQALGTVNPVLGLMSHAVDWSKVGNGLARTVAKQLPVNVGLYAGTALGDRSPVTEKNFAERVKGAEALWGSAQKTAASGEWLGSWWDSGGKKHDVKPEGYLAQQKGAYKSAMRPASIQYEHYPSSATNALDETGWLHSIIASITDPSWRAATSVGRANMRTDAQGNTYVIDNYDFNKEEHFERPLTELKHPRVLLRPTRALDAIGAHFAPDTGGGRPVKINLGRLGMPKKRGN
jgi:hypothetical protein